VAPYQVVVLPVNNKDEAIQAECLKAAQKVADELKRLGVRVILDDDFKGSLGFRMNKWELEGVPLRVEIGGRELEEKSVQSVRRDNFAKSKVPMGEVTKEIPELLMAIQKSLHEKSRESKEALTHDATTYEEFQSILSEKKAFVRVPWCEDRACEDKVKQDTKATPRVLEMDLIGEKASGKCFHCDSPPVAVCPELLAILYTGNNLKYHTKTSLKRAPKPKTKPPDRTPEIHTKDTTWRC
jgi:prolyl-tRNA synthetase